MDTLIQVAVPLLLLMVLIGGAKAMVIVPAIIHGKHVRRVRRQG